MHQNPKIRLLGRFLFYLLVVVLLLGTAILTNVFGPSKNLYTDDSWKNTHITPPNWNATRYNVVLDQHTHTLRSDGKLTLRQTVEWHLAMGYNAVVITDHNIVPDPEEFLTLQTEYASRIVLIPGMEWTTSRLHMNLLGISNWSEPIPSFPSDDQIQSTIDLTHAMGGLVTYNHILWSVNQTHQQDVPTREEMQDWGIDFIEIVNDDSAPLYYYDAESIPFCEANNIGQITGTDMHDPDALISGGVHGWTYLNASAVSYDAIMSELRAKRTRIEYSPAPYTAVVDYAVNPAYRVIAPLSEFGGIFTRLVNMEISFSIISVYLSYIVGIFVLLESYTYFQPQFWKWWRKRKEA